MSLSGCPLRSPQRRLCHRKLAIHAEGGAWKVAREFLTFVEGSHSLVSEATEDAAARLVHKREKRDRHVAKAGR